MIIPRDYQIAAAHSIPKYFSEKKGNPILAMPTGTGKSVVIAMLVQMIMQWPGQRVIIATHVKELIAQNYEKMMAVWPNAPAGIFSSGLGRKDRFNPITFVGIASVAKRAHEFGNVDILIVDECHLIGPKEDSSYRKFIDGLKAINPKLKVVGLTATAWRTGLGKLTNEGGLFTDICFDLTTMESFNWLIEEGYLAMLMPKNTSFLLDTSEVKTVAGEFNQSQLQLAVDKTEITRRALREAMEYGHNRNSWLLFGAGVEHAIHIAQELTHMGVECGVVHSDMSDGERDRVIASWKSGKLRAISNNGILTTGVDNPMLDFIVMLRPTKSTVLWVQMLGRGTRPVYAEGFDLTTRDGRLAAIAAGPKARGCLCMDFAGNTEKLGPINDPRIPGEKGKGGGEAPAKLCMSCGLWNHPSAKNCEFCGAEFTFGVKLRETAGDKDLIKSNLPIVETFKIDQITYSRHLKKSDGTASMKVSYFCGLKHFMEWVPIESIGSPKGIARRWWKDRGGTDMPDEVDEAIRIAPTLRVATHLRVWVNKQYPEIMACDYTGTDFGKHPPIEALPRVSATTIAPTRTSWGEKFMPAKTPSLDPDAIKKRDSIRAAAREAAYKDLDFDIPF
jgi:DNA repair protein RadD